MGVLRCRHHTGRLVEQVVDEARFHPDLAAVELDDVDERIDPLAEVGDDPVDRDAALVDVDLTHPTAPDAGLGEDLLQALALGQTAGLAAQSSARTSRASSESGASTTGASVTGASVTGV